MSGISSFAYQKTNQDSILSSFSSSEEASFTLQLWTKTVAFLSRSSSSRRSMQLPQNRTSPSAFHPVNCNDTMASSPASPDASSNDGSTMIAGNETFLGAPSANSTTYSDFGSPDTVSSYIFSED